MINLALLEGHYLNISFQAKKKKQAKNRIRLGCAACGVLRGSRVHGMRRFMRHAHVSMQAGRLFQFSHFGSDFQLDIQRGLGGDLQRGIMSKSNGKKLHQIFINMQESLGMGGSCNFSLKYFFFFISVLPLLWSFNLKFSFLEKGLLETSNYSL